MFVVLAAQILELTNPTTPKVIIFYSNLIFKSQIHLLKGATISRTGLEPLAGTSRCAKIVTDMISPPTVFPGRW